MRWNNTPPSQKNSFVRFITVGRVQDKRGILARIWETIAELLEKLFSPTCGYGVFKELETVTQKSGVTTFAPSGNEVVREKRIKEYLTQLNCVATSGETELVNCFISENIFYRLVMKNLIKLEMKTLYYHFTDLNKKELP